MTRRLGIDFGPRTRSSAWWGIAILLAGLMATIAVVERHRALDEERERLEAGMRERGRSKPTAPLRSPSATQDVAQRQNNARRSVVRALGRPWEQLFTDIEAAASDRIALLALEPDPRRGEVRLAGEAREPQALYDYIAALERTGSMSRVSLTQHEAVRDSSAGAVRFVLIGVWQGVRG